MPPPAKRIAILTSGGDCSGLNAIIRAVVLHAEQLGWETIGLSAGTHGLLMRPPQIISLTAKICDTVMMRQGGTILGTTNKGDPFAYPMPDGTKKDRSEEIIEGFRMVKCDAMIGIGGDGSFAILRRLAQQGGFQFIGIPKTIDNDLNMTELSVGFDTAVSVATEALDRLQPTAASHDRVMVLEVMGRDAGHIALTAGIAGGADVILIPEIPYDIKKVAEHIKKIRQKGRNFALVVVSEAVKTPDGATITHKHFGDQIRLGGIGQIIGEQISKLSHAETRVTVLGHVQRGGQPIARDRLIASAFGVHSVELIKNGKSDRMVAWVNRGVTDVAIADAIKTNYQVEKDSSLVKTAKGLGICMGD